MGFQCFCPIILPDSAKIFFPESRQFCTPMLNNYNKQLVDFPQPITHLGTDLTQHYNSIPNMPNLSLTHLPVQINFNQFSYNPSINIDRHNLAYYPQPYPHCQLCDYYPNNFACHPTDECQTSTYLTCHPILLSNNPPISNDDTLPVQFHAALGKTVGMEGGAHMPVQLPNLYETSLAPNCAYSRHHSDVHTSPGHKTHQSKPNQLPVSSTSIKTDPFDNRLSNSPSIPEFEDVSPASDVNRNQGKKFKCHYLDCDKAYLKKSHLVAHIRTHTGERPFICTYPYTKHYHRQNKKFSELLDNLNIPICGQRFCRSDQLSRHNRKHFNLRPFCCPICSKTFFRADHCKAHTRTHKIPNIDNLESIVCETSGISIRGKRHHYTATTMTATTTTTTTEPPSMTTFGQRLFCDFENKENVSVGAGGSNGYVNECNWSAVANHVTTDRIVNNTNGDYVYNFPYAYDRVQRLNNNVYDDEDDGGDDNDDEEVDEADNGFHINNVRQASCFDNIGVHQFVYQHEAIGNETNY